jgi:hypothetical protein
MVLLASGIVDECSSLGCLPPQYCSWPLVVGVEPGGGRGWDRVFGTLLGFEESHSSHRRETVGPLGLVPARLRGWPGVGGRVCCQVDSGREHLLDAARASFRFSSPWGPGVCGVGLCSDCR